MRPHEFDPFDAATLERPYQFYAALREHAPVYRAPGTDWYYVSRHADIREVAMDPTTYSSNIVSVIIGQGGGALELVTPDLPFLPVDVLAIQDPPKHGRQRKVMTSAMGRDFLAALEVEVKTLVDALLTPIVARERRVEWMSAFAFHLPMTVALDLMSLPRGDVERVKVWSDHAIALLSGMNTRWQMAGHIRAGLAFWRWCQKQMGDALAEPRAGLMGALTGAVHEGVLSRREAASIVMQILIAGSDSSASMIGSATWMLANDLDLQDQLRADPSLVPAFLEETLRLEAPFQGHFRQCTRDCELAGTALSKGDRLLLLWASANRDPAQFDEPDSLRLDRSNGRAHMAFGHGIHLCIGAPIARMEGVLAISELLRRTKRFVVPAQTVRHRPSVFVRTLERFELDIVPAR